MSLKLKEANLLKRTYIKAFSAFLSLLLLGSCIFGDQDNNFLKRVEVSHPVVTVSKSKASTGEFVEVTLTSTLMARSKVEEIQSDVFLGLCLLPNWLNTLDNCNVIEEPNIIDFEPSEAFSIKPGDTIVKQFTLNIEANQTYKLTHTFSFTANQAGTVTLIGKFKSYDNPQIPDDGASVGTEQAIVTFE